MTNSLPHWLSPHTLRSRGPYFIMKRRSGSSTPSTRLIAQQSSSDPSVTLFNLPTPDNESSVLRPSKRPKVASASSPQKTKAKTIKQALETPHAAPARWRETYDAIREMRARITAPVDTMGCDTAKWKETDPRVCPSPPSDFIWLIFNIVRIE